MIKSYKATLLFGAGAAATLFAPAVMAYVGPGAGLGMLGVLLAVLAAILATVVGLVLWPLRALARRRKVKGQQSDAAPHSGNSDHS